MENPKFRRLCKRLKLEPWGAAGILESIWQFTAKQAPAGDIGRWSDEDIAEAIGWHARPARELVEALRAEHWLDADSRYRLVVHDWPEHCDDTVHNALARSIQRFCDGTLPKLSRLRKDERAAIERAYAAKGKARKGSSTGGSGSEPKARKAAPRKASRGRAHGKRTASAGARTKSAQPSPAQPSHAMPEPRLSSPHPEEDNRAREAKPGAPPPARSGPLSSLSRTRTSDQPAVYHSPTGGRFSVGGEEFVRWFSLGDLPDGFVEGWQFGNEISLVRGGFWEPIPEAERYSSWLAEIPPVAPGEVRPVFAAGPRELVRTGFAPDGGRGH